MVIKAKMRCESVMRMPHAEDWTFNAVYSSDKTSENYTYSEATPSATLKMSVTNKKVWGQMTPGKEYILTFEES
jgi:hypothetical protein